MDILYHHVKTCYVSQNIIPGYHLVHCSLLSNLDFADLILSSLVISLLAAFYFLCGYPSRGLTVSVMRNFT